MAKRKKSKNPRIEKGIPLPPTRHDGSRIWREMEVGDSVLLKGKEQVGCHGRWQYLQKKFGWKFTTRKVAGGTRVWRIK